MSEKHGQTPINNKDFKYTIFEIDDEISHNKRALFETAFSLSDETKHNLVPLQEIVNRELHFITTFLYICRTEDFENFVRGSSWFKKQKKVLRRSGCKHRLVYSENLDTGKMSYKGRMKEVEKYNYKVCMYNPEQDKYYVVDPTVKIKGEVKCQTQ